MDFLGKTFTLGSFEGVIQLYLPEKNCFLVKFNGTDLLEVDATTVLNLLLQKDSETKSDDGSKPKIRIDLSNKATYLPSTNIPTGLNLQHKHRTPNLTNTLPNLVGAQPSSQPMFAPNVQRYASSSSADMFAANQNPNHNIATMFAPPVPGYGFPMHAPPMAYQASPFRFPIRKQQNSIQSNSKNRFHSGLSRHRSLSQPQPLVKAQIEKVFGKSQQRPSPQRRRRESLIGRIDKTPVQHSIHDNCNFPQQDFSRQRSQVAAGMQGQFYRPPLHPLMSPLLRSGPILQKSPSTASTQSRESGVSEATKTEIFKRMRKVYNSYETRTERLPLYETIEGSLLNSAQINAGRISTLRSRNIAKKVFAPLKDKMPCLPERYIVNSLINVCPLCGTSITLNKLGSHINWFKHLSSSHGLIGSAIVQRFEFFETNRDPADHKLNSFPEEEIIFKNFGERIDEAPLESPDIKNSLIPFTTKVSLETLIFDVLIKEGVLNRESILLQELLAFSLLHYKVVELSELTFLFPKLRNFQEKLGNLSHPALEFYNNAGHVNILPSLTEKPSRDPEKKLTFAEVRLRVLEFCSKDEPEVDLDWRVLLFSKAMKENVLSNCSIIVQELLVLGFFYFGFITQRTPKKFRIFEKLLSFFGGLYKISCKCYDLYVGDGPTGAAHTRGKPVNPSKELIRRYNHYGLSRKSLQRALAKEHKESAQSEKVKVNKDVNMTRFKKSNRRSSVKRKNSVQTLQTRRRRSSIKEYIPIASEAIQAQQVPGHLVSPVGKEDPLSVRSEYTK